MIRSSPKTGSGQVQGGIAHALELLQNKVEELAGFYGGGLDFNQMVYPLWSARDVLAHLVFWHESFARNLKDASEKRKPNPLKGSLAEVNRQSVDSNRGVSIEELIERLRKAQKIINEYIFDTSISLIPYKQGSRSYSRLEHLEVVTSHIGKHLKDLNKKLCPDQKTKKS